MTLSIKSTPSGYVASGEIGGDEPSQISAETLAELVSLLSAAGCHSTDISDAVNAAGLDWPGGNR